MKPFRDVFIEVTGRCNLKCCHCFRRESENINVSVEDIDERLGMVKTKNVIVTGGEPTMHPELEDVLAAARKHVGEDGNLITITNGVWPSDDVMHVLGQADVVNVSLDWPDARHDKNRGLKGLVGNVQHVVEMLTERLPTKPPKVNILTTMFKENMDAYEELIDCAWFFGADGIVFDRYIPYNEPPTALTTDELRKSLKVIADTSERYADLDVTVYELFNGVWNETGKPRHRCKQRAFVNVLGRWSLCPFYPRTYSYPVFIELDREDEPLPKKCSGCDFSNSCHGGCPASRLVKWGTMGERDPLCDYSP